MRKKKPKKATPKGAKKGSNKADARGEAFELKVTLHHSDPPIWRRFEISSRATLADLHNVLQIVMEWEDSHLHEFVIQDNRRFRAPNWLTGEVTMTAGDDVSDARNIELAQLKDELRETIVYVYDFGDDWTHVIELVNVRPATSDDQAPVVLEGKLASPLEDCGGVWGYYEMVESLKDPEDGQHEEMLEWVGEEFDPESYDLKQVNKRLRQHASS